MGLGGGLGGLGPDQLEQVVDQGAVGYQEQGEGGDVPVPEPHSGG